MDRTFQPGERVERAPSNVLSGRRGTVTSRVTTHPSGGGVEVVGVTWDDGGAALTPVFLLRHVEVASPARVAGYLSRIVGEAARVADEIDRPELEAEIGRYRVVPEPEAERVLLVAESGATYAAWMDCPHADARLVVATDTP